MGDYDWKFVQDWWFKGSWFGQYQWQPISLRGSKMLVLTRNIIARMPYHPTFQKVAWESSGLRAYLNGTFYQTFTEVERRQILCTPIKDNNGHGTMDNIFLLSVEEYEQKCLWGRDCRKLSVGNQACYWWLRDIDNNGLGRMAASIEGAGVLPQGFAVTDVQEEKVKGVKYSHGGVRPAMWLELENGIMQSEVAMQAKEWGSKGMFGRCVFCGGKTGVSKCKSCNREIVNVDSDFTRKRDDDDLEFCLITEEMEG